MCSGSFKEFVLKFVSINSPTKFENPTPNIDNVRPVTFWSAINVIVNTAYINAPANPAINAAINATNKAIC